MSALKPFCINDLDYTMGWVSGASVDAAIGVGTYYLADARNLSKGRRPSMSRPKPPRWRVPGFHDWLWRVKNGTRSGTSCPGQNARNTHSKPTTFIHISVNGSRKNIPIKSSLIVSRNRTVSSTRSLGTCRSIPLNTVSLIPAMHCRGR